MLTGDRRYSASAIRTSAAWRISDGPARRLPTIWLYGAAAISALLAVTTALHILGLGAELPADMLRRLSLTSEKNLGAWWSGMLLAVLSLHAYDGHVMLRAREPGAATGWALIAALLLFLSADEVGSFHERLAGWSEALGLGSWSLILALGAVLAAVLGRALVLLWSAGGVQRRRVWPLVAGFGLLGSVPLQEFVEHRIDWQTDVALALRGALEEGTELAGMLVLLGVAMSNTAGLAERGAAGDRPAFAALHELRRPLTVLGLVLAPVLALAAITVLVDQYRGHGADWLAAVALLAAALAAARGLFSRDGGLGWPAWGLAGLCCLASIAAVAVTPIMLVELGPVEVSLRMLVLGVAGALMCVMWLGLLGSGRPAGLLGVAALCLLATAVLLPTSLMLVYLLPQLLGLTAYWVSTTAVPEKSEGRPAPRHRRPAASSDAV